MRIVNFSLAGALAAIVAAGLLAYSNTFHVPFLFDDIARIVDETAIRTVWPPSHAMQNSNRPLAHYTFALNYAVHGYEVFGYHAVNLFIHLVAALALFGIVHRTLLSSGRIDRLDSIMVGFAVALVWVVHPLDTQAVTYIVQRLESLMSLSYLSTLYLFVRGCQSRFGGLWFASSVAACAFGMGCKEVMVTAPCVVLWYDRVFVAVSWRDIVSKRWGYYICLAASWSVLAWSMLHYDVDYRGGGLLNVEGMTPWTYLLSQSSVIVHYLRLVFWPQGQCAYYAWPIAHRLAEVAVPFAIMSVLLATSIWAMFRYPRWGFLGGCFFLILAPTSSVIPIKDLAFEHRMYLPLAALVTLVLVAVYELQTRLLASRFTSRASFITGAIGLASVLGVATYQRNRVYESDVSLWTDTLEKSPQNAKVWVGLGAIYAKDKRREDAERCFTRALAIAPNDSKANAVYGGLLIEQGKFEEARQRLDRALASDPTDRDAIANRGHLMFALGQFREALECFETAVQVFPSDEELQTSMIVSLVRLGYLDEALKRSEANLVIRPNSPRAHTDLAACLAALGHRERASQECQKAIELDATLARAHATLAMVIAPEDPLAAIAHLDRACTLEPNCYEFLLAMGNLQMNYSPNEAIRYYEAAMRLNADNVELLLRTGMAWEACGAPEKGLPYFERVTQLRPDMREAQEIVAFLRQRFGDPGNLKTEKPNSSTP